MHVKTHVPSGEYRHPAAKFSEHEKAENSDVAAHCLAKDGGMLRTALIGTWYERR